VCALGASGQCLGCLRTGDEIARWAGMTPAEQWDLIDELARRREATRASHSARRELE
jgi:predicted Fe-S protein YdhL (DUF1289 family)